MKPLRPDKNRYYEFIAAPRLRGIATITSSSVVVRVVGARTLVAPSRRLRRGESSGTAAAVILAPE